MDEDTTQNITPSATVDSSAEISQPAPTGVIYAGFFSRLLAVLIDAVVVGIAGGIIGLIVGIVFALLIKDTTPSIISQALGMLISWTYSVYFISQKGQTLGKKAMDIRVQNESTGQNLDVVSAILREVIGKALSAAILLLGYFWMLWDGKKQTWHDKIAKSVVVKVK